MKYRKGIFFYKIKRMMKKRIIKKGKRSTKEIKILSNKKLSD